MMSELNYKEITDYLKELEDGPQFKEFAPVYLIYGEELLYKTAFEALLDALIPAAKRSLNCMLIEGINDNIQEAIELVNTYSLLSGTKVVAICDSRIFYSRQDDGMLIDKTKAAMDTNDIKGAAKYFLNLLGLLNLTFDDVSKENREKALNLESRGLSDDEWLDKIITHCVENDLSIPSGTDNVSLLTRTVEKGFPKGNHLIITTDMVDKRTKLFKAIRNHGVIIDCSVPKGERRADKIAQEAVLKDRMSIILDQFGKTMDKDAYRAMYEMTGFDLRTFLSNLQKLVSYVGDRAMITVNDVEHVLKRTKKDPIYELTNAISDRNIEKALFFLDSLIAENIHPLQILAAMTNQIRRLLIVKGFVESSYGASWHAGVKFEQFKKKIMPLIQAYDRDLLNQLEAWDVMLSKVAEKNNQKQKRKDKKRKPTTDLVIVKNPNNPYPVYQMLLKSEMFTKDELISSLEHLSQSDLRFKSTGQNQKIILEEVIFSICKLK